MVAVLIQIGLVILILCSIEKSDSNILFSLNWTTTIRGICCIIVVFSHLGVDEYNIGYLHFVAVSFFFMFSGYGLIFSIRNKADYIDKGLPKHLLKLIIPYLFILLLKSWLQCDIASGGIYYLNVIILFYVAFYLIYKFIPKYQNSILILTILIYSLLIQYYCEASSEREYFWRFWGWGSQSIGFIYGVIWGIKYEFLNKYVNKYKKVLEIVSVIVLGISGFSYLMVRDVNLISWRAYILRIIISFAMLVIIVSLTDRVRFKSAVLEYVGGISYYIFICHGFVISILEQKLPKNFIPNSNLYIIMVFVITLGMSALLAKLMNLGIVEKVLKHRN